MSWAFISWQSIIAGTVTALAASIVMGILGVALGFSVVKPTRHNPTSGLGTTFGVWGILSVIVSLAAGGYVAGIFAGTAGAVHGFMVWATVLLAGLFVGGAALGGAMRTIGSAVKSVGSGAMSMMSSVGHTVSNGVGPSVSHLAHSAVDHIQKSVNLEFEPGDIGDKVASVLRDTGVETLQPEYLKNEIREMKSDLKASLYKLRLDSDTYNKVVDEFLAKEKARIDKITGSFDKEAAVTALMNNRGISRNEALQELDNAMKVYNRTIEKAQGAITDAQRYVNDTMQHMEEATQRARVRADEMARTAAKSALAAAVALIIGAVICVYAGRFGDRHSERYGIWVTDQARVIQIPLDQMQARR